MKSNYFLTILLIFSMLLGCGQKDKTPKTPSPTGDQAITAFYGGGIMYKEENRESVMQELKDSGLSTIIVWTIHINEKGDLNFNAEFPLVENGEYVGNQIHSNFAKDMEFLKSPPTGIKRIEFGLSAYGSSTFEHVKTFYKNEGFGPGTTLYKNFEALKNAIPSIDAFNNDDEVTYDVESAVAFTKMLAQMGFKNAIVPYKKESFWRSLVEEVNKEYPGNIDRNYLQCYAGGRWNDPCDDSWDFGIKMIPGLWGGPNGIPPDEVNEEFTDWREDCFIEGGFLWDYEKFALTPAVKEYINAIKNDLN